jgi:hypothetical protein
LVAALLTLLLAIMVHPHRIKREPDDAKAEKERLAKELFTPVAIALAIALVVGLVRPLRR